jgi:hypothetical protein
MRSSIFRSVFTAARMVATLRRYTVERNPPQQ